jgi:ribonuclease BN (tRNA processing enzyme)
VRFVHFSGGDPVMTSEEKPQSGATTRRAFLGAGALAAAALPSRAARSSASIKSIAARQSRLILLGTGGGPTPKKNRSAPAQAIIVNGACYVIDCGNGVARQMVLADIPLASIRSVFITHHHSDHNADYGNLLLLSWESTLATRVDTYGPPPLAKMTRLFLEMNDTDIRTRITDEGRQPLAGLIAPHEIERGGLVMQDENIKVTAALVDHPPIRPAFAYRLDCPDRSIVFSGDTRPSANLVRLAEGADVLVHEVMYWPAIDKLARSESNAATLRKHLLASHTTTDEVGMIAMRAGVKTLVLTHFVPGGVPYIKDEVWHDAVRPHFSGNIVVGRDLLEI